MHVTISGSGAARVIQFVEQHRIPKTKKKKTVVIETIGNYEKLLNDNPNIIDELKAEARRRTEEKKKASTPVTVEILPKMITSEHDNVPKFRFGHALIASLWKDLALDKFFKAHLKVNSSKKYEETIFTLVLHRMMNPQSIHKTYQNIVNLAGVRQHHQDLYYDILDSLDDLTDALINHLCEQFEQKTTRKGPIAYYDVTTYAFESVDAGELRLFGFSKDHKNQEVQVVMGLLIDNQGIPISYHLFPGNTMDQATLKSAVEDLKQRYKMDQIVVVADRGLNRKENLLHLVTHQHDFVMGYTLKKAPEFLRALAFNGEWDRMVRGEDGEVTYCEKVVDYTLEVDRPLTEEEKALPKKPGRPKKKTKESIDVNVHITWSASRAQKDYCDRVKTLDKIREYIDKPSEVAARMKRGRNQYIAMDIDTSHAAIDEAVVARHARYDGLYAYITNQKQYPTEEVCGIYHGLWKIEESFRVLKSDLKARPVYVWKDEHVRGHFCMCFLSLCLMRYAQYKLKLSPYEEASAQRIQQALQTPEVVVHGTFPVVSLIPIGISNDYLALADALNMPPIKTIMTRNEFKKATHLDLTNNFV